MEYQEHVQDLAKKLVGNWQHFPSFSWRSSWELSNPENYTIVYTNFRDSSILEESNSSEIEKRMAPFVEKGDVLLEKHNHFAVGWVKGYCIPVFDKEGKVTEAFEKWAEIQFYLEDYPILNEEDFNEREYQAELFGIEIQARDFLIEEAPKDWVHNVHEWLCNNAPEELENTTGSGAYPDVDILKEALQELELFDEENF